MRDWSQLGRSAMSRGERHEAALRRQGRFASAADEYPPLPNLARYVPPRSLTATRVLLIVVGLTCLFVGSSMVATREIAMRTYREREEEKIKDQNRFLRFFSRATIQKDSERLGRVLTILGTELAVSGVVFLALMGFLSLWPVPSMLIAVSLYIGISAFVYYIVFSQANKIASTANFLVVTVPITVVITTVFVRSLRYLIARRVGKLADRAEIDEIIRENRAPRELSAPVKELPLFYINDLGEARSDDDDLLIISEAAAVPPRLETPVLPSTGREEIVWLDRRGAPLIDPQPDASVPLLDLRFDIPASNRLSNVLIALAFVTVGAAVGFRQPHLGIFAVLPVTLAIASLWMRTSRIEGRIVREGIELREPHLQLIWFAAILSVDADIADPENLPESFTIDVAHRFGVLSIPGAPGIDSRTLYRVLLEQSAPHNRPYLNPQLIAYTEKNREVFGPNKVWAYDANQRLVFRKPSRIKLMTSVCFLTWIVWTAIGASDPVFQPWGIAGGVILIVAVAILVISFLSRVITHRVDRLRWMTSWGSSTLVITPLGLAMRQGKRFGKVRWDQISEVNFKPPTNPARQHVRGRLESSIYVWVEGVPIEIMDIYNVATRGIYDRIMVYWKHNPEPASA